MYYLYYSLHGYRELAPDQKALLLISQALWNKQVDRSAPCLSWMSLRHNRSAWQKRVELHLPKCLGEYESSVIVEDLLKNDIGLNQMERFGILTRRDNGNPVRRMLWGGQTSVSENDAREAYLVCCFAKTVSSSLKGFDIEVSDPQRKFIRSEQITYREGRESADTSKLEKEMILLQRSDQTIESLKLKEDIEAIKQGSFFRGMDEELAKDSPIYTIARKERKSSLKALGEAATASIRRMLEGLGQPLPAPMPL